MKLRNILGLSVCALTLSLGFTACSDDDDKNDPGKDIAELSGTWKFSESTAEVEVTDPDVEDAVIEAVEAITDSEDDVYVFKLDGTFESQADSETDPVDGTFKLENGKLTLTGEESTEVLAYSTGKIKSSVDVKSIVAEQLEIDESVITKAIQVNTFSKVTK